MLPYALCLPRGMERFREYIKTMTDAETGDLALPLVAMNPMGKDHVPALIDDYLALGAETIAEEADRQPPTRTIVRRGFDAGPHLSRRARRLRRSQGRLDQPLGERVSHIASKARRSRSADG